MNWEFNPFNQLRSKRVAMHLCLKLGTEKLWKRKPSLLFLISKIYGIMLAQSLLQIMFLLDLGNGERTFLPI